MPPKVATGAVTAEKRISRELMDLSRATNEPVIFFLETIDGSLLDLRGYLCGPQDSPFQGGVFRLEVKIPDTYPFTPPQVKFLTRVWHPNISSQTGLICVDILKDQWVPAMSLRTLMFSLQSLLTSPEPDDPQDAVVARQFKELRPMYIETARFWTYVFAIDDKTPEKTRQFESFESQIRRLMDQTHSDRVAALNALSCSNWNFYAAVRLLPTTST